MVHFDGFDVTKEIIYGAVGEEFRRRGVSLLIVDHPGVGAALRLDHLHSGPHTERPAKASVDYLLTRDDVDPERIGIVALSLGGYYAPRAAAFEHRFNAASPGARSSISALRSSPGSAAPTSLRFPAIVEHAQWVFGTNSLDETRAVVKQMTLETCADKIVCPLLIVHGENDRQIPLWHAEKTYQHAVNSPDRELKIFHLADGGAEHCGADNNGLIVDYITDWVAEKLGASPQGL